MRWSDLPLNPTDRMLRQFAAVFFVVIGGLALWRGSAGGFGVGAAATGLAACVVGLVGAARPRALRPLFVGWTVAAFPVGWLISNLVLALIYFGLFFPIGAVLRLTGRIAPDVWKGPAPESYWIPRPERDDPRSHLRPF